MALDEPPRGSRTNWAALCLLVAAALGALVIGFATMKPEEAPYEERPLVGRPRVVALAPAPAVMLRDMGLESLLVGRHAYDLWSDPALPVCGDQTGIDYEALERASPTHVILQWGERNVPRRLRELAKLKHWKVTNLTLLSLDDARRAVGQIANDLGIPEAVGQGAKWDQVFEKALKTDPALAGAGRVLLLGAVRPPAALGPGSWHHDILLRIGGLTATAEGSRYMTMDVEDVLRLKPDAIVVIEPRAPGQPPAEETRGEKIRLRLGAIGRLDIPAVKNGRMALIDDDLGLVPGTNMARFADELRAVLEGWSK